MEMSRLDFVGEYLESVIRAKGKNYVIYSDTLGLFFMHRLIMIFCYVSRIFVFSILRRTLKVFTL